MASSLNIEAVIKKDASGDLFEEYDTTSHKELKKRKSRKLKKEYKEAMKDSNRFDKTYMSQADHTTLFMQDNDSVTFFHAREFTVGAGRDPEIEEDFSSPEGPFTSSGTPWTMPQHAVDTGAAGDKKWKAGPYKLNPDSGNQRFYKFTIWTTEDLILDPDIVTEP
jgi:hypothetical protein